MPKLNTTIDNLELKSNKVFGNLPSASWTDAQYPSAKTLYTMYNNLVHPVNSIFVSSVNTNPSETFGGTWELVDKSFKNTVIDIRNNTHWVKPSSAALSSELGSESAILLTDHTVSIRLNVKTTIALTDTEIQIGKLTVSELGINSLSNSILYDAAISDGGNCTICYRFDSEGNLAVFDVINAAGAHSAPAGTSFFIHIVQPIPHYLMQDAYCDKFYWKRTA